MKNLLFLLAPVILLASCRGADGPPGPPGNANIQSVEFTAYPGDFVPDGNVGGNDYSYYATYNFPEITTAIADYGLVHVYVLSTHGWAALPYTLTTEFYQTDLNYAYDYGTLSLIIKDSDLQTQPLGGPIDLKVVIAQEGISKTEIEKALKGLSDITIQEISRDI